MDQHTRKAIAGVSTRVLLWSSAGTVAIIAAVLAVLAVTMLMIAGAKQLSSQCPTTDTTLVGLSAAGSDQIPAQLLPLYRGAAARYELGPDGYLWLAAVNKEETDFGRNLNVSTAGAIGWMQFMPATWAQYGVDGDRDGVKDPWKPADGIYGAANLLHASGAPGDWHAAVFAYNHAEWYFDQVQAYERKSAGQSTDGDAAPASTGVMQPIADTTAAPAPAAAGATGDGSEAAQAAEARTGRVAYALADTSGRILVSHHGTMHFNGRSMTKAMLLVADLRRIGTGTLEAGERSTLEAMIEHSDNPSANRILAHVGEAAVRAVATTAGMTEFRLSSGDRDYRLGESQVTAEDQARFFAQIDQLMPAAQRQTGMAMLAAIAPEQRWGFFRAGLAGTIYAKAGWMKESDGEWMVNQAAQLTIGADVRGMAVLSDGNPTEGYGHDTLRLVGAAVAGAAPQQADSGGNVGGCDVAGAAADPGAAVQLAPGDRAKLLPDGQAAAPADAPAAVKAMIAAGNRIVGKPYVYGGGHGQSHATVQPAYDCSSSVTFILYWGGFIPDPMTDFISAPLGSTFGEAGPGQWVTIRGNTEHVYMYVAGLRWDTHNAVSGEQGNEGIGWHTGQRDDIGFGARHPPTL